MKKRNLMIILTPIYLIVTLIIGYFLAIIFDFFAGAFFFMICCLFLLISWIVITNYYNTFVTNRNNVSKAWSIIDVQLNRRADLIPNLVNTVKGYSVHEQSIFTNIAEARNGLLNANGVEDLNTANNQLSNTLKSLFAVAEAYPELKADSTFLKLQAELRDTEDKISNARSIYNNSVMIYNNSIDTFPANFFADIFGFKDAEFFHLKEDAVERHVPKVEF